MRKILYTSLLVLLGVACSPKADSKAGKIVYMDNFQVFENFKMKKEYDEIIRNDMQKEANWVDSLGSLLGAEKNVVQLDRLKQEYQQAQQIYNQKFERLSTDYTTKVTNRLNEYIEKFAKSKGFDIVLGTSGQGSILYVEEKSDITQEILKYINERYEK